MRPGPYLLGVDDDDDGALGQHVEQRLHPVDEHRREGLHALDGHPGRDLREQVGDAGEHGHEGLRAGPDGVRQEHLPARRRPQPVLGDLERALVRDREPADLLDGVAPELDAQRVVLGRREDVEDPAADGELAAPLDHVDPDVRRPGEGLDDRVEVGLLAGHEPDRGEVSEALDNGLHDRTDGRDDDADGPRDGVVVPRVREPPEHREAAPDGVGAWAEPLVRQRLPGRELDDGLGRQVAAQGRREVLGLAPGRGD